MDVQEILEQAVIPCNQPKKTRWSVVELYKEEFKPIKWAIPDVLPEGLSILAGRPKMGKSWLAMQFACSVGCGGAALGKKVEQGNVFYLALEDGARRLQERLRLQHVPQESSITFETQWEPLSDGGLNQLEIELASFEYRLIVIDTFSRASNGLDDQQDIQSMTQIMGSLQRMALSHSLAILLIDHHRKAGAFNSDPIDDILGSTGKSAVADCLLGLYRERGKPGATLRISGRDVPDTDMTLTWDAELYCWQYAEQANQIRTDSEKGKVLAAVKDISRAGRSATTTTISDFTGMDKSNVSDCLKFLSADGKIKRGEKDGVRQPYYPIGE